MSDSTKPKLPPAMKSRKQIIENFKNGISTPGYNVYYCKEVDKYVVRRSSIKETSNQTTSNQTTTNSEKSSLKKYLEQNKLI